MSSYKSNTHRLQIEKAGVTVASDIHVSANFIKSIQDFDLWYLKKASGSARIKSQHFDLKPGTALILYPNIDAEIRFVGESVCYWTHFKCFTGQKKIQDTRLFGPEPALVRYPEDSFFFELSMHRIVSLVKDQRNSLSLVKNSNDERHETLLAHLLAEFVSRRDSYCSYSVTERYNEKKIFEMLAKIRENPAKFQDVTAIASHCGYNPDYFSQIFKKAVGVSPSRAIIQARIDQAKWLLHYSLMNISEVADSVGFSDVHYFSRRFKKETGWTPTEYRMGCQI